MFGVLRLRLRGKPPEGGTPNQVLSRFSPDSVGRLTHSFPLIRPMAYPSVSLASPPLRSVKRRLLTQSRRLAQTPYNSLSRASAKRDTCSAACGVLSVRGRERFLQRERTDRARRRLPRS